MVNVLAALDANAESDLKEAEEKAAVYLRKYMEQKELAANLRIAIEVRKASGATMGEEALPLKRESA